MTANKEIVDLVNRITPVIQRIVDVYCENCPFYPCKTIEEERCPPELVEKAQREHLGIW